MVTGFQLRASGAIMALLVLAGCESSTRIGSLLPDGTRVGSTAPAVRQAPPPPLTAAPSAGDVESSALPPPTGAPLTTPTAPDATTAPVTTPSAPSSVGTAPGNLPPVAARPPQAPAPSATSSAAPSRSSLTGNWALTESAGARCRVTLSSAPKLDLYGAGTNGCQAKELQRVNAWELNGSEVILYEPGGGVVARLRQAGEGTFTGVSTRSGAPVSMSK